MKKISEIIGDYFKMGKWAEAKSLLEKEMIRYPTEYWLHSTLSEVHSELGDYEKAFFYARKSYEFAPNDFLVISNYAYALSHVDGKQGDAVKLYKKIIKTDLNIIAYNEHNEGMKWAKSLVNDSRVRLAEIYASMNDFTKELLYLKAHLLNRKRGISSIFSKKEIEHRVNELLAKKPV